MAEWLEITGKALHDISPHTQPQPIVIRRYHHEITCTKTIEKHVVPATTVLGTGEIQRQVGHCKAVPVRREPPWWNTTASSNYRRSTARFSSIKKQDQDQLLWRLNSSYRWRWTRRKRRCHQLSDMVPRPAAPTSIWLGKGLRERGEAKGWSAVCGGGSCNACCPSPGDGPSIIPCDMNWPVSPACMWPPPATHNTKR